MKTLPFIAVRDTVIVLPDEEKTETASGILLPDEYKEKPCSGTIVAVGWDNKTYLVGCTILYSKYGGQSIYDEKIEYIVLDLVDILAVKNKQ